MTTRDEYKGKCEHCAETMAPKNCGPAEVEAIWRDADGATDGVRRHICRECLDAGAKGGPGFEAVQVDTQATTYADGSYRFQ